MSDAMTLDPTSPPPMAFAGQVIHPGPPLLRVRYRDGVQITPYGVPDWIPYGRLLVELPPAPRGLGWDEARVLAVQTANELGRRSGDPLWTDEVRTPPGWTWARQGLTRLAALVPIELHASFRHIGGVSTANHAPGRRGVAGTDGAAPGYRAEARLATDALATLERHLGHALPSSYRSYLARSNGGRPTFPAVHPRLGFVVDQPLFAATIAGEDVMTDLLHQNVYLRDRLEPSLLPIGFVQGGLLALKVGGEVDLGSVWYLDDDDPRDQQGYAPDAITRNLLYRLAPHFTAFWSQLRAVPAALGDLAARHAGEGWARLVSHPALGRSLPRDRRSG